MQAKGDVVICIVADLQDPPSMIKEFIKKWEEGYKIVIGVKTQSEESQIFFAIRKAYYNLVGRLSEIELIKNFTGFGLYDQRVIETLRSIEDPYPYFRGPFFFLRRRLSNSFRRGGPDDGAVYIRSWLPREANDD